MLSSSAISQRRGLDRNPRTGEPRARRAPRTDRDVGGDGPVVADPEVDAGDKPVPQILPRTPIQGRSQPVSSVRAVAPSSVAVPAGGMHPAARKLLAAAAQHAPGRFTWGQLAMLAGLKPSGGHFNSGRKNLRDADYVTETSDPGSGSGTSLVEITPAGLAAAGEVPASPSTPAERLDLWCSRLPAPAPEMLRTLVARTELHGCRRARGSRSARSRPAGTGIRGSLCCATTD